MLYISCEYSDTPATYGQILQQLTKCPTPDCFVLFLCWCQYLGYVTSANMGMNTEMHPPSSCLWTADHPPDWPGQLCVVSMETQHKQIMKLTRTSPSFRIHGNTTQTDYGKNAMTVLWNCIPLLLGDYEEVVPHMHLQGQSGLGQNLTSTAVLTSTIIDWWHFLTEFNRQALVLAS